MQALLDPGWQEWLYKWYRENCIPLPRETERMSDPHGISHGATAAAPFTEAELAEFQASDIGAGKVIVLLMAGIFTAGLVLYTIVALAV